MKVGTFTIKTRALARALFVAIFFCLAAQSSFGNGMRLASQDGFATARGEAFTATADNASAIYYNPAGITQIEGSSLRAGIYGIYLDPTFTSTTPPNAGNTYRVTKHYAAVPQSFFTHHVEDSAWSFGFGLYAPYGASIGWPDDTGFRTVATYGRLTYLRLNPVIAYQLAPNLSIAAGALLDFGQIKLEQGLLRRVAPFENFFRFSGQGYSAGYNVGILWKPLEQVSLGATFRSQTSINFNGRTEFEQQPIIQSTRLPANAEFDFPLTVVVGISYRPTTNWNFEFDADYTDWSSLGQLTIKQDGIPPFPVQQDIPVTLNWQASWMFCVGATRQFENGWHVSTGYVFNQNSVPDDFYSPLAADLDRHFITIGAGRKTGRVDLDVAYQLGYGPARTVAGSAPPSQPGLNAGQNGDGTYDFISHAVMVTVGLHF